MITASNNVDSPRKRSRVSELDHGWTGWNWVDRTTTCTSEENSRQDFHTTYEQLELLGEGGFGSVFAGVRGEDHFPVAIKRIHRDRGHLARRWADTPSSGGDHAENGQRIRGEICSHCTAWFCTIWTGSSSWFWNVLTPARTSWNISITFPAGSGRWRGAFELQFLLYII